MNSKTVLNIICFPCKLITFSSHEFNTHEHIKITIGIRNDSTPMSSNLFIKYKNDKSRFAIFLFKSYDAYMLNCLGVSVRV